MNFFGRSFILLWQGQMVSQIGNQAFLIAATLFTLERTGSSTLVGAVLMASTIPLGVIGPAGGTVADRHSRRTIMIVTDILRAAAVGTLAVVLVVSGHGMQQVMALIAVSAFCGVLSALFTPAVHALIPDLVPAARLASANSLIQASSQTAILIGQALGGIVYVRWGAAVLLSFDALSYAYGALATFLIDEKRQPVKPQKMPFMEAIRSYAAGTREGLSYVRAQHGMGSLVILFAGVNFLFMPVFVLLPLYVRNVLQAGPEWYGFALAASGAGALIGSAAGGTILGNAAAKPILPRAGAAVIAGLVLLLARASSPAAALAIFAGIGVVSSVINIAVMTTLQSTASPEIRGRVVSLIVAVSTAAVPLGMAVGGIAGDLWPSSIHWIYAGCGLAIGALAAWYFRR
jgi:predicted MFS family arabinose efflux permease